MPRRNAVLLAVLVALAVSILGFLLFDALWPEGQRGNLYKVAPVQIVLGSVVFLLVIAVIVAIFASLNLADKTKALALPEGSVRALLALILLIIFVIFGNIIYGQARPEIASTATYSGLSQAQVEELPGAVLTQDCTPTPADQQAAPSSSVELVCSGTYQQMIPNPERSDLGLQIVTALLTLVTAIASFYFGAKAGGEGPTPPTSDATPPTVVSIRPGDGDNGVPLDERLTAVFSKPMAAGSVNGGTVTLAAGAAVVSTTVTLSSDGLIATIVPHAPLQASTQYTATIVGGTSGVTDQTGRTMGSDYTWSFTSAN